MENDKTKKKELLDNYVEDYENISDLNQALDKVKKEITNKYKTYTEVIDKIKKTENKNGKI